MEGLPRTHQGYEEPELSFGTELNWHGGFCHAPGPTPAGDKPPRYRTLFRLENEPKV